MRKTSDIIVEQGTNYGQGDCVMGSYAVTNVVMYETDYPVVWRGNGGGGGSSRSNVVTKEANYVLPYTMSDLSIDWASASTEKDGDKLRLGFTNNYDEVRLKLPRTLDMSTCAYVQLNMPEQNVPIAIKLYWKGQQVDVDYYNDIKSLYTLVPAYSGMIDAIGIMSLATPNPEGAFALVDSVVFGLTEEPAPEPVYNTIVINGDFADEDMGDWSEALWGDGVTITRHTADKPIFGNTYTYATYSRRTSPYQCFAQDITARVQQNETYKFSFWAKLSNDYKNAPENQRVVQFAPYTVDKDGNADYNPRLDGNYVQVLEPGVWTYFEGTYKVTNSNPISKVVIRILEQGTNYGQGDCVMGSYSVAGVHMEKYIPEPPEIDEDVPNLKDVTREVFGDDFIMGTAVSLDEMEDLGIEMLVNKHFNAVTLGNALKPDALFNYSNDQHTKLQTITFNGQKLEVPTLYFDRAEEILDTLKKWNEDHPEDPIRVVGKVMITEFDLKASGDISNEEKLQGEYLLQAERYHDIYLLLQKLDAEEGIDIGGFIVWGTVDKYSWLQGGSELGGGSDGTLSHCPLLFDSDYKVKPAYWAFVDYTMVDPDWMEEDAAENVSPELEPANAPETPEAPAEGNTAPESEQEAVPVADTNPVVKDKKNNPIVLIAVIAGVLVAGVGAGTGFYLSKKKKK